MQLPVGEAVNVRPRNLAFIGLGVMGYPMAGHLANAGYAVTVYNRSQEKAAAWVKEYRGNHAATPAEAAEQADMVFTCVGNDDDVRSVTLGKDGVLAGLRTGGILVDHTTASPKLARELETASQTRYNQNETASQNKRIGKFGDFY